MATSFTSKGSCYLWVKSNENSSIGISGIASTQGMGEVVLEPQL